MDRKDRHKKVRCLVCGKSMRSDHLKRHTKTHMDLLSMTDDEVRDELKAELQKEKRLEEIEEIAQQEGILAYFDTDKTDTEEKKPNGKRRYCEEKYADPINEMLTITKHREAKFQECVCGYKIKEEHICERDITSKTKLIFIKCDKDCETCCNWTEAERNLKRYTEQWYVDIDAKVHCKECGNHSEPGEIPKTCGCEFYLNKDGKECCNT